MIDEFAAYRHTIEGISYTDIGKGPVVLFVHGVFTSGKLWRNCVQLLSSQYRCISIDLPAHGYTPPIGDPSVWGLAKAVDTLIQGLDLHDIHLVGNDTGGGVAQIVLSHNSDRITSFALTNCDTEGNFPPPAFRPAVWLAKAHLLRAGAPLAKMPKLAKQIYRTGYQNVFAIPDDIITGYLAPTLGTAEGARFMNALLASMTPKLLAPIHPFLSTCKIPTAIIWGTGDIFFHRRWADWLVDLIPGATEVVEIRGARLFFPDERAAELVDALKAHWE